MNLLKWVSIPLLVFVLTGCLYPESELNKNNATNQEQLDSVQASVLQYQEQESGLLPIKTKEEDTPPFLKYPVDFSKLRERGLIGEAPGNSFENGGHYQYVIIHPDEEPTVKVVDLRLTEALRSLQLKVDFYENENEFPPLNNKVAKGVYDLKYEEMGLESPPTVDSPYSDQQLPVYINERGELLVDYRKELYQLLEQEEHSYDEGDDIRYLLTDHTPFAPAYSPAYTIEDGEPVFMSSES
ncbi:hypothetical protein GCM10010954_04710 [Halobacillus andaensis]|uniref:Uncharacterized protein n=1 Tax=Halobacillus andaensis TaxID=1176239 RepID=A0A917AY37_HALAA|nr:hypothetical protein [Halobacillus andaensis]MBP2003261.1 hypothetical protein [Halobacillus andaensis]GGF09335.1 hypothetical protein GCM10010954_04710 [Halobacillus andaensis]